MAMAAAAMEATAAAATERVAAGAGRRRTHTPWKRWKRDSGKSESEHIAGLAACVETDLLDDAGRQDLERAYGLLFPLRVALKLLSRDVMRRDQVGIRAQKVLLRLFIFKKRHFAASAKTFFMKKIHEFVDSKFVKTCYEQLSLHNEGNWYMASI